MIKFIFEVTIKPTSTEGEYIEAWKRGSAIIQKEPGANSTILHRKMDGSGKLLAIARWESKELRDAAMKRLDTLEPAIQAIINKHKEFGDTTILGFFEEITEINPQ